MTEKKSIVCFIRYTEDDPFSRYRYYAPLSYFQDKGYAIRICPFFSSAKSKRWYRRGKEKKLYLFAYWQRFFQLLFLKTNDVVFIQYPMLSPSYRLEKWLLRKQKKVVMDWVDVSFQQKKENGGGKKIEEEFMQSLSSYDVIITSNTQSTRQVLVSAKEVVEIPPCISIQDYMSVAPARLPHTEKKPFRIGWIGSIETSFLVIQIRDCLLQLHDLYNIQLVLIGFDKRLEKELQGLPFINHPKKWEADMTLLKSCDVGVLPLPAEANNNSHLLFNMMQYMACRLPVVASSAEGSIAVNRGNDNLFARTTFEWYSCLAAMIQNASFYKEVGRKNGDIVAIHYSVEMAQKAYLSLFQNITDE